MKAGLFAIIAMGIVIVSGSAYLYGQMHDCLNPPEWLKLPRSHGFDDCMKMYYDGEISDWSKERERHTAEQAHRVEITELFSNVPEVMAFYEKYDDVNVSVRVDHVSYFTGSEDGLQPRMNLHHTAENYLTHVKFYCFNDGSVQTEVPQEDIVYYLENRDCALND